VSAFASAVEFNGKGDRVAIGSRDGSIEIVSSSAAPMSSASMILPFAMGFPVVALAWHPQREWLAVGGDDGTLVVLDLVRRAEIIRLPSQGGIVGTVAWSPSGNELAFVCDEKVVCVAHVASDRVAEQAADFLRFSGHNNAITRLAWTPDGARLASADAAREIVVWSLIPDRRVTFDLRSSDGARATAIAFSPIGHSLAAARPDGDISLWDAAKLSPNALNQEVEETRRLHRLSKKPLALAWGPDGSLSVGYEDASVALWSSGLTGPARVGALASAPSQLAFTKDGARVVALAVDDNIYLTEAARLDPSAAIALRAPPSRASPRALAVDPKQSTLIVSYEGGQISIWDLATQTIAVQLPIVDPVAALSLSVSPDGRLLAATGGDRFVKIYDLSTGKLWDRLETQAEETGGLVAFSLDGKLVAAIGADDRVYVWQFGKETAQPFVTIDAEAGPAARSGQSSGQYASGLAWVGLNQLAVLTAAGTIRIVNLDAADWQSRLAKLHFNSDATGARSD
jgi:WD40 repeat protein